VSKERGKGFGEGLAPLLNAPLLGWETCGMSSRRTEGGLGWEKRTVRGSGETR